MLSMIALESRAWGGVLAKIFFFVTLVVARSLSVWAVRGRLTLGFADVK